jgi:hypothetical protein
MKVGTIVRHRDEERGGPKGLGEIINSDQWSVNVRWRDTGKVAVYHPRILRELVDHERR